MARIQNNNKDTIPDNRTNQSNQIIVLTTVNLANLGMGPCACHKLNKQYIIHLCMAVYMYITDCDGIRIIEISIDYTFFFLSQFD